MRSSRNPSSWARFLLEPFRMGHWIGVVSIVIVLAAIPCRSSATDPVLWLVPGTSLRVKLVSADNWIEGRLVSITNDSLHLATSKSDTLDIPLDTILRARGSLGRHSAAGKGALIGSVVGMSTGIGLSVALVADDFLEPTPGGAVALTVVTGACGAILGTFLGAPFHVEKWTDVREDWATGPTVGRTPGFNVSFGWTF